MASITVMRITSITKTSGHMPLLPITGGANENRFWRPVFNSLQSMKLGVFRPCKDFKVTWVVIQFIAVFMVNYFIRQQLASNHLLSYYNVLIYMISVLVIYRVIGIIEASVTSIDATFVQEFITDAYLGLIAALTGTIRVFELLNFGHFTLNEFSASCTRYFHNSTYKSGLPHSAMCIAKHNTANEASRGIISLLSGNVNRYAVLCLAS